MFRLSRLWSFLFRNHRRLGGWWEGFRFTFLRHFTRPEDSGAALRSGGQMLYDPVLERTLTGWPKSRSRRPGGRWLPCGRASV